MEDLSSFIVKWDGPVRVESDEGAVNALTATGWRLLAVYQDETLEYGTDQVLNPHPRGENDHGYEQKMFLDRSHVCRTTRFVLGMGAGEHMEAQAARIEELAGQLVDEREHAKERDERVGQLEQEIERLKTCNKNVSTIYEENLERLRQYQDHARRMEEDLAKARKAMGELQWREVMGDGKK